MPNSKNLPPDLAAKLIVRGIHLDLTDALRVAAAEKTARLLRHNDHIIRLRVDLELDKTHEVGSQFIAKGHIEIAGPDLLASVTSDDCYKSLDLLVDKLDGLLRRRHGLHKDKRNHPHPIDIDTPLPKAE
jgi:putative sigma-54 modulation protein